MRTIRAVAIWTVVAACALWVMVGCATTTTRTVTTDKAGNITETTVTSKASDTAALALAGQIATAYAPRGIVREEKSTDDLSRILRGRPITRQEVAHRFKP